MESIEQVAEMALCRLCGEENKFGTDLFSEEENRQNLSELINRYLPVKVKNDDKMPKKICPGCNIQLEATKSFMDLIIQGQDKLRNLYKAQEKQIENLHINQINGNIDMFTFHSNETGEKFFVQIISDDPLFPPDHELCLKAEGLDRPKRKRGRPPKLQNTQKPEQQQPPLPPPPPPQATQQETEIQINNETCDDNETNENGKRRRRIKIPSRYMEAIQGKELDKVFKQEGVIDEESFSEDDTNLTKELEDKKEEIIGRLENENGEDLGQPIIVNKTTCKSRFKNRNTIERHTRKRRKYQCEICKREFLHHGRYELHKRMHQVKYICNQENCNFSNEKLEILEQHQQEKQHTGYTVEEKIDHYGTLQMPSIETENQSENNSNSEIIENGTVINKKDNLTCDKCLKTFSCKQNYDIHIKAVHNGVKPYACEWCDKRFSYANSLRIHQLQHKRKSKDIANLLYHCPSCPKTFRHPSSLQYHRDSEHANGRRFVCNKCDKPFKHRQLLQRHQLVHSDERPHRCSECDSAFKTRANLLHHSRTVHRGQRTHWCQQCDKSFVHKTALKLHERWHSGVRPYKCDICQKEFSQKGNLAEHRRIHTGEKPYHCDDCGRAFTTSSQYRLHRKRHLDERPHRCIYCSKSFLHKVTLKYHVKRHFNMRPYQCQLCEKTFPEIWSLRKHERLHTGEKPYTCEICGRAFADSSNLAKHRRTHQNNKINNKKQKVLVSYENQNDNNEYKEGTIVQYIETNDSLLESSQIININSDNVDGLQPLHLQQLVDQDGNLISFTTADGQQVKVVTNPDEGDGSIQGLLPDGTLIPINLTTQEKPKDFTPPIEDNFEKLNDVQMEGQLLENNIQFLSDNQNMCLVTTYNIDDSIINSQYLTMP